MLGSSLIWPSLLLGPTETNVEGLAAALLWGDPAEGESVSKAGTAIGAFLAPAIRNVSAQRSGVAYSAWAAPGGRSVSGQGEATAITTTAMTASTESGTVASLTGIALSASMATAGRSASARRAGTASTVTLAVGIPSRGTVASGMGIAAGGSQAVGRGQASVRSAGVSHQALVAPLSISARPPMAVLQTGASIVGTGTTGLLKDGRYRQAYKWTCSDGSWAALDLGTDAARTHIAVCLSNEDNSVGDWNSAGLANFTLKTSVDSTDGTNGTWTAYPSTAYPYLYALRVIPFSGCRWLRLEIGAGCTGIDEFEVWNCSNSLQSGVVLSAGMFVGDSITAGFSKRGDQYGVGQQPSWQSLIRTQRGQYPVQLGCGMSGVGIVHFVTNLPTYLEACPVGIVMLGIGTNDSYANTSRTTFRTRLESILATCEAAGAELLVARIPWSSSQGYNPGSYGADRISEFNAIIDDFATANGLRPGPDLYNVSYAERAQWFETDAVHPVIFGRRRIYELWANATAPMFDPSSRGASASVRAYALSTGSTLTVGSRAARAARGATCITDTAAAANRSTRVTQSGSAVSATQLVGRGLGSVGATGRGVAILTTQAVGFGQASAQRIASAISWTTSAGVLEVGAQRQFVGVSSTQATGRGGVVVMASAAGVALGSTQMVGAGQSAAARASAALGASTATAHGYAQSLKLAVTIGAASVAGHGQSRAERAANALSITVAIGPSAPTVLVGFPTILTWAKAVEPTMTWVQQ